MSSMTTVLRHAHLPGITKFARAQSLQQSLVQQFLAHKALVSSSLRSPCEPPLLAPPAPTILTFTPTPVYTLGRREHGSLSDEQEALLLQPLNTRALSAKNSKKRIEQAEVLETQRGGQTTFHGPGQLVIYPIIDLKPATAFPPYDRGLTVRSYVELLEQATIDALGQWGIASTRTEDPGVWKKMVEGSDDMPRKIAALGVHLRRNITSYGVGLNIKTDLKWFDRIVACGLVGKGVTTMDLAGKDQRLWGRKIRQGRRIAIEQSSEELTALGKEPDYRQMYGPHSRKRLKPATVARAWVRAFAKGLYGSESGYKIRKISGNELGAEIEEYRGEEDIH
jgi:lipoate-protein ligase B